MVSPRTTATASRSPGSSNRRTMTGARRTRRVRTLCVPGRSDYGSCWFDPCPTAATSTERARSPADRPALELLVQPCTERCEVVENGRSVHLANAGERIQGFRPRLRHSHRQHRVQASTGLVALVHRAAMEPRLTTRERRHRSVKLELEDAREKVSGV